MISIKKEVNDSKPEVFRLWLEKKIKQNGNAIIIFNGATGSGKTYGALRLACDISEWFGTPFNIDKNMDFNFQSLMKKMLLPENSEAGTVFLMEEVGSFGSGASAREWQSKVNKFFFSFLQTSRHRNQILIMTCPSFGYLEKGARELVHFQFESIGIDRRRKLSYFKPFYIQVNRRTGKMYFKFLKYRVNGLPYKGSRMAFKLPPKDIRVPYEKAKLEFTTALNKSMLEEPENKKKSNIKKPDYKKIIQKLMATHSTKQLSDMLDISIRQVQRYVKSLND